MRWVFHKKIVVPKELRKAWKNFGLRNDEEISDGELIKLIKWMLDNDFLEDAKDAASIFDKRHPEAGLRDKIREIVSAYNHAFYELKQWEE